MTWKNPLWLQSSAFTYPAQEDRFIIDTLFSEGVMNVAAGQGLTVQRPAGANMQVYVPPLDCIIKGDDNPLQGSYLARMTVAEFVDVTAPSTTNPRIDLLVAEITDAQYVTPTATLKEGVHLRLVPGTPAASPVAPALPVTAIPLATVQVPANAVSIVNANITDLRTQAGAASLKVGTQAQPLTAAQILALTPFDGQILYNTTQGSLEAGDAATGTFASTRPLGLFFGDGSDGDVTITGAVTLVRDMNYRNLTVTSTGVINTNGFRILVTGTLRNAGTIQVDGGAGTDANYSATFPQSGVTYGTAGKFPGGGAGGNIDNSALSRRLGVGGLGGAGSLEWYDPGIGTQGYAADAGNSVGNTGTSASSYGGAGGTGGMVSGSQTYNRGAGGNAPAVTYVPLFDLTSILGVYGVLNNGSAWLKVVGGAGGGGGGNIQGAGSNYTSRAASGGGGGGVLVIVAEVLINTGTISARGGRGGNASGPYAGPGGGGGGGAVVLFTRRIRDTGTVSVSGGAAGSGGANPVAAAGANGTVFKIGV